MNFKNNEKGKNIRIQENSCGQIIHISFHRTFMKVYEFLEEKGYKLKSWDWHYEDTTFPGGTSTYKKTVFVALKPGETPSEDKIYTAVYEREIRRVLAHF